MEDTSLIGSEMIGCHKALESYKNPNPTLGTSDLVDLEGPGEFVV
jgi:hypothetical protein